MAVIGAGLYFRPGPMEPRSPASVLTPAAATPLPAVEATGESRLSGVPEEPVTPTPENEPKAICPLFAEGSVILPSRGPVSGNWHEGADGYERARREQEAVKAPLLVYFFTDWCRYCKTFDRELLQDREMEHYLRSRVVTVRINPEAGSSELAVSRQFGVKGYPSVYVVPPGGEPKSESPFRTRRDGSVLRSPPEYMQAIEAEVSGQAARELRNGYDLRQSGDLSASIASFDKAIDMDPADPEAYFHRAISHEEAGAADRAMEDYRRALELKPAYLDVYRRVDHRLAREERWAEIAACWTNLLEREPGNAQAYLERSGAYARKGDRVRARADAERACGLGAARACESVAQLGS